MLNEKKKKTKLRRFNVREWYYSKKIIIKNNGNFFFIIHIDCKIDNLYILKFIKIISLSSKLYIYIYIYM